MPQVPTTLSGSYSLCPYTSLKPLLYRNPRILSKSASCGMKYEGTLRSADRNNQGICDMSCYALLRSER